MNFQENALDKLCVFRMSSTPYTYTHGFIRLEASLRTPIEVRTLHTLNVMIKHFFQSLVIPSAYSYHRPEPLQNAYEIRAIWKV